LFRDDTLHTNQEDRYLSEEIVVETIKDITNLIKEVFPHTDVYPALGNHDYHPKNQQPVGSSKLLDDIADLWSDWLGPVETVVFQDGK